MTTPVPAQISGDGAADRDVITWDLAGGMAVWDTASGAPTGSAGGDLAGTYPNPTIGSAGMEAIRDMLASVITAGTNITVTVDDALNTITVASTGGYTDEQVRDVIGAALVAGSGMTVTVNDGADTITLASSGGYTDENARDAIGTALVAGTGITVTVNDGADTITIAATGASGGDSDVQRRATGSGMSVTSTTWADLNTGLDLTLTASVGQWVVAEPSGAWSTSGAVYGALDVVTMVSGSPVTSFSMQGAPDNTSFGTYGWGGLQSTFSPISGALRYQLQSGDISGGTVTLRLRVRVSAAGTKSIHCSTTEPFLFSAHVGD